MKNKTKLQAPISCRHSWKQNTNHQWIHSHFDRCSCSHWWMCLRMYVLPSWVYRQFRTHFYFHEKSYDEEWASEGQKHCEHMTFVLWPNPHRAQDLASSTRLSATRSRASCRWNYCMMILYVSVVWGCMSQAGTGATYMLPQYAIMCYVLPTNALMRTTTLASDIVLFRYC